jgi:hypothetical protein
MKIKKGDFLVVKDTGLMYTTYREMFKDLKFKNIELNRNINDGEIVAVFNIGKHKEQKIKLYAVTTFDGRQGLFSKKAFYKK